MEVRPDALVGATPASDAMTRRLGVLISGRGSNLRAILDATRDGRLDAQVAVVISNRAEAKGLHDARQAGVDVEVIEHVGHRSRASYDRALVRALHAYQVGLVCLAGFMRIVGPTFVHAYPNAILNVHPSLLPAFPGLDAQRQAWAHGVKITGATVHLVTEALDAGPIVAQASVPVLEADTPETLASRILEQEHRLYPEAIKTVLDGRYRLDGRRFVQTSEPQIAPAPRERA